jgi:hypothetical protein
MGTEKIEKKLPDDIVSLIDQEASSKGMTRQEVVSHLIGAVKGANLAEENKQLKKEIELVHKQQEEEHKEIRFLREEISKFSTGLTSLAIALGEGKGNSDAAVIESLSNQVHELVSEISVLKESKPIERQTVIENNMPLIMMSILSGLLLVYLIISTVM